MDLAGVRPVDEGRFQAEVACVAGSFREREELSILGMTGGSLESLGFKKFLVSLYFEDACYNLLIQYYHVLSCIILSKFKYMVLSYPILSYYRIQVQIHKSHLKSEQSS